MKDQRGNHRPVLFEKHNSVSTDARDKETEGKFECQFPYPMDGLTNAFSSLGKAYYGRITRGAGPSTRLIVANATPLITFPISSL